MKLIKKYFLRVLVCLSVMFFYVEGKSQDSLSIEDSSSIVESSSTIVSGYDRKVPDTIADEMRNDPDFAYANDPSYWEKKKESEPGLLSKMIDAITRSAFLKILLYIVVGALIIFIVYQVVIANNFFVSSKRRRKKEGATSDSQEDEWDNLDEKINGAVKEGNYRTAVRYMYLKTLKLLNENNLITLHAKSTNHDYIQQMYKHATGSQFRQLTRIYEYVWYGEFVPNETQFERIRTNFNQFNTRR